MLQSRSALSFCSLLVVASFPYELVLFLIVLCPPCHRDFARLSVHVIFLFVRYRPCSLTHVMPIQCHPSRSFSPHIAHLIRSSGPLKADRQTLLFAAPWFCLLHRKLHVCAAEISLGVSQHDSSQWRITNLRHSSTHVPYAPFFAS